MVKVEEQVLSKLCEKLFIPKETLAFLGAGREDSDGIVYTYQKNNRKMVLKILAFPASQQDNLEKLALRVQYANYLGENGIQLAYPMRNENGSLYETVSEGNFIFTGYVMEFCEGVNPKSEELNDSLAKEWGKLTGRSHQLTKKFTANLSDVNFGYQSELDFFYNWCKNPTVKKAWKAMGESISTLPVTKEDYGFIHNDNHQFNILVSKSGITLIDFDCATPQFFLHDIITPGQGIMFDLTGGMHSKVSDEKVLRQFYDSFLSGYEQENHLSDFWYGKMNLFLNYRRLLLYTCMEDWIVTQPELKDGFLELIQNPPVVF